jgi:hypothetical protein
MAEKEIWIYSMAHGDRQIPITPEAAEHFDLRNGDFVGCWKGQAIMEWMVNRRGYYMDGRPLRWRAELDAAERRKTERANG